MSKNQDFDLLKPVPTSPQRPRHQVKRSITELSSPIKLPRYHHLHHLHHRKDRDNDDHTFLSSSPMLHLSRGSLELPRSEGATPYANSESGLRISMLNSTAEDTTRSLGLTTPQPPSINQDELLREQKEKAASRIAGLRKSLLELNTFSTTTTRRLDDTYYAVLEKLSMLQSTIVALRELAGMSQELDESIKAESQGLVAELEQQVDSFGQFDDQQQRIEELQGRIHTGRNKVEALSKRVDAVRHRIESWERADMDWQERTRRRLKIIWIITSVVVFSLVLVFVGAQYTPSSEGISALTNLSSGSGLGEPDMSEVSGNRSQGVTAMVDEVREALIRRRGDGPPDNDVFRAFDEL
ncbi:hypothetical protein F4677DRAFT_400974 [Hypoxylon crocopeplum]|nr:hypothetical protein F4677DRAFT_400974 [Hypoxylon crocopeplum]